MGNIGQNVELPQFTEALYDARELAMSRMQAEAEQLRAEGIVGRAVALARPPLGRAHHRVLRDRHRGPAAARRPHDRHAAARAAADRLDDRCDTLMTIEPSGLGPMGDVQLLAAMLRTDRADVASYARVLTGALADAAAAGHGGTGYHRTVGDRLAGRPGRADSSRGARRKPRS